MVDYLSVSECINWLTLLGVEKPFNYKSFEIFSAFDINIWIYLLISLILLSIINFKFGKKHQNKYLSAITSLFNHLEALITKSGKFHIFTNVLFKKIF